MRQKGPRVQREVLMLGLLIFAGGCHAKNRAGESVGSDKGSQNGHVLATSMTVGRVADIGRNTITAECEHESYANASKGLIVSETGLHEDVFALRDRTSLAATVYTLNDALQLEELLRAEAKKPANSAEKGECVNAFAEHLETLTDALVQADKVQKEMDLSAFEDSTKQADEQLEKKTESAPPAAPSPH
jgi:hypothetical protein